MAGKGGIVNMTDGREFLEWLLIKGRRIESVPKQDLVGVWPQS